MYGRIGICDARGHHLIDMDTSSSHVLLVDNDPVVCSRVCDYLGHHGYRVTAVSNVQQAGEIIDNEAIDLLLLEMGLRGDEGLRLTRAVRESSNLPIVILSGLMEEADCVMGLELGADDYVTKPFSTRELLARIRAVLRRSHAESSAVIRDETLKAYRFAGWELNMRLHRLQSPDHGRIEISRGEFRLLRAFLSSPQRVLSRDQLLSLSRLHSTEVYDRSIDIQVMRLRRKIEPDPLRPRFIKTVRGAGYFFDKPVTLVRGVIFDIGPYAPPQIVGKALP
jgi:two-component system, OmpR family, response regulator